MSRTIKITLCLLTGLLLGLSFPPAGFGIFATVGFIPLFLLLSADEAASDVFRHTYASFFIFNLITLYWPGGFVHMKDPYLMMSGALLLLAHPMFMTIPVLIWHSVRKTMGLRPSLLLFPVIWVAFEYAHSVTQLSFPWLTLGYSMSYDLDAIQMASVAGVYAVSFWILVLNVLLFFLISRTIMRGGRADRGFIVLAASILAVYALPYMFGSMLDADETTRDGRPVSVVLVQPNIDPFEKWSGAPTDQLKILMKYSDSLVATARADRPDGPHLLIWPETAVPYYILSETYRNEYRNLKNYVDEGGIPLLSGIPDFVIYADSTDVPAGAKRRSDGTSFETFNSSMLLIPGSDVVQKYAKTHLVPFAERVPYSDVLGFLDAARWNFGLGGWSVGRDTALFRLPVGHEDTIRFGNMICYESIYPGYVGSLVNRGAAFLTVVTNDSWWGNTAGPYQHRQFAVLRAIENRRWVAQCANGGISFLIDPAGGMVDHTGMFTEGGLTGSIHARTEQSFYSRHGDWFSEICLALTFFVFVATGLHRIFRTRMEKQ